MTGSGQLARWQRDGDVLSCRIDLHPDLQALAGDHVQHRLRMLRACPHGLLHPGTLTLSAGCLRLGFPPRLLDQRPSPPDLPFRRWRDTVLLPLLESLGECHQQDIVGFLPPSYCQGGGRWIPPPTWFLPPPQHWDLTAPRQEDLALARDFLAGELRRRPAPRDGGERRQIEALRDALGSGDAAVLFRLVCADVDLAAQQARSDPPAPSFLRLLTEAELLARLSTVFPYRARPPRSGTTERVLEVDPRWRDPHFPAVERLTPQELWDQLIEESRTTPLLAPSLLLPNPLDDSLARVPTVNWIGVHPVEPLLFVQLDGTQLPAQGYVRLFEPGDIALLRRKRAFVSFAGAHPALWDLLSAPPPVRPFTTNPQPRQELEEAVLDTVGIFAVQGPPGTGKTHLATEVVRRFLLRCPAGRVLVCAKEHFALDHIARKITAALKSAGIPMRGFRSVSAAKLRRSPGDIDATWLGPAVAAQLAKLSWDGDAAGWASLGAVSADEADQRLSSLGKQAANLFFCTTLDQAMVEFLEHDSFDLVIVEEAGKCYPSELLHAACLGRTVLLIGDQCQLPPYQEKQTRAHLEAWQEVLGAAHGDQDFRHELAERFGETYQALSALLREQGPLREEQRRWQRPFEYLFDRLQRRHFLDEQFRMEAPLSRTIGAVFYPKPFEHRKLELVAQGVLPARPLQDVVPAELDVPMLWIDTPHVTVDRAAGEDGVVRRNPMERDLVLRYLRGLRPGPLKIDHRGASRFAIDHRGASRFAIDHRGASRFAIDHRGASRFAIDLVILTPYRAQKSLLLDCAELREVCARLSDTPFEQVVRTTDEYQGREAELTVLSLVRNNGQGAWGFMVEPERLNVMFSRTRFRQVVVGCGTHVARYSGKEDWLRRLWSAYQQEARDPDCARILRPQELPRG